MDIIGRLFNRLNWQGQLMFIPDKMCLRILYYFWFKKKLNIAHPITFNEKLQWLKLYDRKPEYTMMVDKYLVKDYVASIIGREHIIPTYGIWDKYEDIDFDALPEKFVIKCTHNSKHIIICKDKKNFNPNDRRLQFSAALKRNLYWSGREWPYKDVKPRIIAEKLLVDCKSDDLPDYKLHCFNGKVGFILVCKDRFNENGLTEDFFTPSWDHIPVCRPGHGNSKKKIEEPEQLATMISIAESLSKNIPFVRVDLYLVDGEIYFGEMTFFPAGGFSGFEPDEYDRIFGNMLVLPKREGGEIQL